VSGHVAWLPLAYRAPVFDVLDDGSVSEGWGDAVEFLGRIQQRSRGDVTGEGRDGLISEYLLLTKCDVVPRARVFQDSIDADGHPVDIAYEVVGFPAELYDSKGLHHYEATLKLVTG
jgi:hypothetical protein